ncbi:MAG: hypothetical protein R3242_10585 [Akkermansiaceae bacterium]|nr:hypothetical protein [Akkermansiaceae bacterium]
MPVGPNSCPYLPEVKGVLDFSVTRRHGANKGPAFYRDALGLAQSLWLVGKPAQAMLQINKAWMADIEGQAWWGDDMDPWSALAWMLNQIRDGAEGFSGDPVRHFQHLASRMSGPRPEPRRWRAWICFHLAERVLPRADFGRDGRQLVREGLWIPGLGRALTGLHRHGWAGEAVHVANLPEFQKI